MISVGQNIGGRYSVMGPIGQGGMGSVFRAVQNPLGRPVAIKVLRTEGLSPQEQHQRQQRFFREAALSSRLNHPNTITVYDYGELEGGQGFYLAMELLEGQTLSQLIKSQKQLTVAMMLHVATQMASSLADAHAAGVVHRDLKPPNVMLVQRGPNPYFVKVLDFGLVKETEATAQTAELTGSQTVLGSPMYMAPERFLYHGADTPSVDIYALGILMYEMLVGRPPFLLSNENTLHQVMMQQIRHAPPRMRDLAPNLFLPGGLEQVVMRCLEKDPAHRYASMEALLVDLTAYQQNNRLLRTDPELMALTVPSTQDLDVTVDSVPISLGGGFDEPDATEIDVAPQSFGPGVPVAPAGSGQPVTMDAYRPSPIPGAMPEMRAQRASANDIATRTTPAEDSSTNVQQILMYGVVPACVVAASVLGFLTWRSQPAPTDEMPESVAKRLRASHTAEQAVEPVYIPPDVGICASDLSAQCPKASDVADAFECLARARDELGQDCLNHMIQLEKNEYKGVMLRSQARAMPSVRFHPIAERMIAGDNKYPILCQQGEQFSVSAPVLEGLRSDDPSIVNVRQNTMGCYSPGTTKVTVGEQAFDFVVGANTPDDLERLQKKLGSKLEACILDDLKDSYQRPTHYRLAINPKGRIEHVQRVTTEMPLKTEQCGTEVLSAGKLGSSKHWRVVDYKWDGELPKHFAHIVELITNSKYAEAKKVCRPIINAGISNPECMVLSEQVTSVVKDGCKLLGDAAAKALFNCK